MKLRLSQEAHCLDERSTTLIRTIKDRHVSHYVHIAGEPVRRTFCPVTIGGADMLADIITGSLYRDGQCLTSKQLRIVPEPVKLKTKPRRKGCSEAQIVSGFANDRLRGMAA